jgi:hypothetical protein
LPRRGTALLLSTSSSSPASCRGQHSSSTVAQHSRRHTFSVWSQFANNNKAL